MTLVADSQVEMTTAALRAHARSVNVVHPAVWRTWLGADSPLCFTVRAVDGWLCFQSAAIRGAGGAGWNTHAVLARNCDFPAGTGLLLPGQGELRICAEIPTGGAIDLPARIAQTCSALAEATLLASDPRGVRLAASSRSRFAEDVDPVQLCEEAGWTSVAGADGSARVQLEFPSGFTQADLRPWPDGGIRAVVTLAKWNEETPQACVDAVECLLLRLSEGVRMVRASLHEIDSWVRGNIEITWDAPPVAEELGHALSALSVACRLGALEAEVLIGDECLAQAYLKLGNGFSETTGAEPMATPHTEEKKS